MCLWSSRKNTLGTSASCVPFLDNIFLEQVGGLYDVEAARQGEGWTIRLCMLEVEASHMDMSFPACP